MAEKSVAIVEETHRRRNDGFKSQFNALATVFMFFRFKEFQRDFIPSGLMYFYNMAYTYSYVENFKPCFLKSILYFRVEWALSKYSSKWAQVSDHSLPSRILGP